MPRAQVRFGRYGAIVRRDDFIPPLPADEAEFFGRATIVLDTNVLLAPYKFSVAARESALRAIESSAGRLWIPHQVGVEFYRNHASNRDLRSKAYADATKQTAQFEQLVTKHLGEGTTHEDLRKSVARVVREAVDEIKAGIEQLQSADTAITTPESDNVLQRIETALVGRLAAAPDPATIRSRTEDFTNWRVPSRIPPGYEDRGKAGTARSAGDFLIWAEILEHAAANNLDILFVTEDGKDDWWEVVDKQKRPHRALVLEFQRATGPGRAYHQVPMETFVRLATEAAGGEADQSTLDEIVAVGKETQKSESRLEQTMARWLSVLAGSDALRDWTVTKGNFDRHYLLPTVDLNSGWAHDPEARQRVIDMLREQSAHHEDAHGGADESSDEASSGSNDSP